MIFCLRMKLSCAEAEAGVTFVVTNASLSAKALRTKISRLLVQRILVDAKQFTIARMAGFVLAPPFLIIVPLLGSIFSRVLMLTDYDVRMPKVLAMSLRTDGNGNFFSMKLVIGVMGHFFAKLSQRKSKMCTLKTSANGAL